MTSMTMSHVRPLAVAGLLWLAASAALADPVTLVSRSTTPPGSANGTSTSARIDSAGRFGVLVSDAPDLVVGQTGPAASNVFLFDQHTGDVVLVSHAAGNPSQGGNDSTSLIQVGPQISTDGNWVAFASLATNLVTGQNDTNGVPDIFLWERATNTNRLVSRAASSATDAGNGFSSAMRISADGRFVVFVSESTDLPGVVTDANGDQDIFLFDRFGSITLISHQAGLATVTPDFGSSNPALSSDGAWVAFASLSTNLITGVSLDGHRNVFLFEVGAALPSQIRLLSRQAGNPTISGNSNSRSPLFSADGGLVVFSSDATDLEGTVLDTNLAEDLFVYSRTLDTLKLLSHKNTSSTVTPDGASTNPSISSNGAFVAFDSQATNLVAGQTDNNATVDVFLWDAATGVHTLVSSVEGFPTQTGDQRSLDPIVSADGSSVVFKSLAADLVAAVSDANNAFDVFHWGRQSGVITLISHSSADPDQTGNASSGGGDLSLSSDGRVVAFASQASDLVADDDNLLPDVFLHGLPALVFADGFESGNFLAWSSAVP